MGVDDLTLTPSSPEINPQSNASLSDQPDLTLRLSLAGIQTSLTRSSSVIGVISSPHDYQTLKWDLQTEPASFLSLHRSSSLPTHADQPGRVKLKELQLLRRMEPNNRLPEHRTHKIKSSHGAFSHSYAIQGHGSVESTKGSSSSQSSLESNDREPVVISQTISRPPTNPSKRARVSEGLVEGEGVTNMVQTMPIVSTIGDGPNGRKVEGLLYKYKKGQICIVCVCHGSFLTPAEFVKHAGGREVANPMKHIHVSCTSFSLGNERKQQEQ